MLKCVHRAGLEASGLVFEPLASSAATLQAEEKQVGVVMLDIGGGTTDIAVYSLGSAIYTATIPVGGNILTSDISLGLKTTLSEAEEVKKRFGAGVRDADNEERVQVRTLDGRSNKEHTTEQLRHIVVPRVLETLRMAKQKIVENVPRDLVLGEVVLTGGGARLPNIEAIAEDVFGLPVRVGMPNQIGELDRRYGAPAICNGDRPRAVRRKRRTRRGRSQPPTGRIGRSSRYEMDVGLMELEPRRSEGRKRAAGAPAPAAPAETQPDVVSAAAETVEAPPDLPAAVVPVEREPVLAAETPAVAPAPAEPPPAETDSRRGGAAAGACRTRS